MAKGAVLTKETKSTKGTSRTTKTTEITASRSTVKRTSGLNKDIIPKLELNWHYKSHNSSRVSSKHVSVRLGKYNSKKLSSTKTVLRIIFRDNMINTITKSGLVFAYADDRMYFKEEDILLGGYSPSKKSGSTTAVITSTLGTDDAMLAEYFLGDYTLEFDDINKLYYIDVNKKDC